MGEEDGDGGGLPYIMNYVFLFLGALFAGGFLWVVHLVASWALTPNLTKVGVALALLPAVFLFFYPLIYAHMSGWLGEDTDPEAAAS